MKREMTGTGPSLSAVFVDYDNIYLSLRRKSEDAAKRFAKDAAVWLKAIELGTLITPTNSTSLETPRRIVMNRCYGNPVPRRNQGDNSADMTSFPFVRHHFLRGGFEIVDCPPLTQQLKNSSDIRMVMDVRDYLHHDTYFDEFIILSGDADFTPVLHRLRAHARRTVIFANDYTAAPYTAISDGEIREADLIRLLLGGQAAIELATSTARTKAESAPTVRAEAQPAPLPAPAAFSSPASPRAETNIQPPVVHAAAPRAPAPQPMVATELVVPRPAAPRIDAYRQLILETIVDAVRAANGPVPIEMLADRAVRTLGQDKTAGTNWAGAGSFRGFLLQNLPAEIRMTEQSPYYAYDVERHGTPDDGSILRVPPPEPPPGTIARQRGLSPVISDLVPYGDPRPSRGEAGRALSAQAGHEPAPAMAARAVETFRPIEPARQEMVRHPEPPPAAEPRHPDNRADNRVYDANASAIQQAVTRIFEACQAPPLGPLEYRMLFELMSAELNENKLSGAQTVSNVLQRATEQKLRVTRDDVRFVFDVVSEVDPWFEQGASANLFAGRFRNFVVARCRTQGLSLSADDIDLIDRLFTGGPTANQRQPAPQRAAPPQLQESGWGGDGHRRPAGQLEPMFTETQTGVDDFPRIVRSRMRG